MKKKSAPSSAFFYQRILIGFAFCVVGALVVLSVAYSASMGPQLVSGQSAVYNKTAQPVSSSAQAPVSITAPAQPGRWPQPNVVFDVLYSQNDNADTVSTGSQNFETAQDAFDDQTADDFVVPAGQTWNIQQVVVTGVYFNGTGPASSFNVFFYTDAATLPGAAIATQPNATFTTASNVFTITLPTTVVLGPGTYWVSVQANLDFTNGQWGWTNRTVGANSGAAWQNPGGGFATACAAWGRRPTCVTGSTAPDQMFELLGTVTGGCTNYSFTVSSGSIVPGTTDTGNHVDDGSTVIALPFTYTLYDTGFNSVAVGSNGHMTFGTANDGFNVSCIPIVNADYAIGPYWTDQCTGPCTNVTGTNYGIFTSISGTPPNRIFNVEWRTAYYNSGGAGIPLNYEVRLYEGQTAFDVIYGTVPPTFTPPAARNLSVGVQHTNVSEVTLVGCDPTGGGSPPVSSGQLYHYTLGCPSPTPSATPCEATGLSENFDGVTAPALPAGWTAINATGGAPMWETTTITTDTAPNAAFVDDPLNVTDKQLDTPNIPISSDSAQVTFRNSYDLESTFDGGVLEVSSPNINGGAFTDVTSAAVGGTFATGGYNATISTNFESPIAGRMAWSGNSGGYTTSVANLGPNVAGHIIRLRFRMASDISVSANGWRIDTLTVTEMCSPAAQALNLSTRMRILTDDQVGIGGFIITGSAPKEVLLRGIGPSLAAFGVPNPLADPVMELHGPAGFPTMTNDNWKDTQQAAIQATGLAPTIDAESAILATLDPGAYTAIVSGKNNTIGTGLVEAYDLAQGVASKLGNISTRAVVSTGADIMIAGFILGGNTGNGNVILRGIGPSLAAFGVPNPLADPTLELHDGNGALVVANDDWQSDPTQAAVVSAAGLAPTNVFESAIAAMLPPGQYTALLAGFNMGTGVGLVEVYDIAQ